MPSTPALLEITVRFFTPESRIASDSVSAMPHRPNPPDMIIMPSLRMPSRADLASGWTLFMKCHLIEGGADGQLPGVVACEIRDWRGLLGEIFAKRQCNASMTAACDQ